MNHQEQLTPHDIRGPCPCGAFMPGGTREDGILCEKCGNVWDRETLIMNGFEWSEEHGYWYHPDRLIDTEHSDHHQITITYKCPMPGCGKIQSVTWESYEFPHSLEGIDTGTTLEGPFTCPDCEKNGVAHSDIFEVLSVDGDPVNTDADPLEAGLS